LRLSYFFRSQTDRKLHSSPTPLLRSLPAGVEAVQGNTILRVVALSQTVLRVREAHNGHLPEDASRAVLPSSRSARVPVVEEADVQSDEKTLLLISWRWLRIWGTKTSRTPTGIWKLPLS
jgi:hypothetical protein